MMISIDNNGSIYSSGQLLAYGVLSGRGLDGSLFWSDPGHWSHCQKCKRILSNDNNSTITRGVSGLCYHTCWECAGFCYRPDFDYTLHYERGIRDSVPFTSGTPAYVLADWLEDQNCKEAAKFMRENRSGK